MHPGALAISVLSAKANLCVSVELRGHGVQRNHIAVLHLKQCPLSHSSCLRHEPDVRPAVSSAAAPCCLCLDREHAHLQPLALLIPLPLELLPKWHAEQHGGTGHTLSCPLLIAPMAMQCMAHPQGELATAAAAAACGVGMVSLCLESSAPILNPGMSWPLTQAAAGLCACPSHANCWTCR